MVGRGEGERYRYGFSSKLHQRPHAHRHTSTRVGERSDATHLFALSCLGTCVYVCVCAHFADSDDGLFSVCSCIRRATQHPLSYTGLALRLLRQR